MPKSSSCPICQKLFPADQIESHASQCDSFPMESEDQQPSTSRSKSYECNICDIYRTDDGYKLEEHISACSQRARDRRNGTIA